MSKYTKFLAVLGLSASFGAAAHDMGCVSFGISTGFRTDNVRLNQKFVGGISNTQVNESDRGFQSRNSDTNTNDDPQGLLVKGLTASNADINGNVYKSTNSDLWFQRNSDSQVNISGATIDNDGVVTITADSADTEDDDKIVTSSLIAAGVKVCDKNGADITNATLQDATPADLNTKAVNSSDFVGFYDYLKANNTDDLKTYYLYDAYKQTARFRAHLWELGLCAKFKMWAAMAKVSYKHGFGSSGKFSYNTGRVIGADYNSENSAEAKNVGTPSSDRFCASLGYNLGSLINENLLMGLSLGYEYDRVKIDVFNKLSGTSKMKTKTFSAPFIGLCAGYNFMDNTVKMGARYYALGHTKLTGHDMDKGRTAWCVHGSYSYSFDDMWKAFIRGDYKWYQKAHFKEDKDCYIKHTSWNIMMGVGFKWAM
jgi:hypothetical protein